MTWLYTLREEDTFWAGLYRQRDKHFMNLWQRLPNWVTLQLCRLYVAAFFPAVLRFLKAQYRINKERFPIYPGRPTLAEVYRSAVFLSFNNVMPPHQFRHGRPEVRGWYGNMASAQSTTRFQGFSTQCVSKPTIQSGSEL